MPVFKFKDTESNVTLSIQGDTPPTEQEMDELLASYHRTLKQEAAEKPSKATPDNSIVGAVKTAIKGVGQLAGGAMQAAAMASVDAASLISTGGLGYEEDVADAVTSNPLFRMGSGLIEATKLTPEQKTSEVALAGSAFGKGLASTSGSMLKGAAVAATSPGSVRAGSGDPFKTQGEYYKDLQNNWMYQLGQVSEDAGQLTEEEQNSNLASTAGMVASFAPIALGPAAVPAFILSAVGHSLTNDYKDAKEKFPEISDDDAAGIAFDKAVAKGAITATVFGAMPHPIRAALTKHLVARYGDTWTKRWIAGRLSTGIEGAALGAAVSAGEKAIDEKAPDLETVESARSLAIANMMFFPWLRKGQGLHTPKPKPQMGETGSTMDAVVNATPPIEITGGVKTMKIDPKTGEYVEVSEKPKNETRLQRKKRLAEEKEKAEAESGKEATAEAQPEAKPEEAAGIPRPEEIPADTFYIMEHDGQYWVVDPQNNIVGKPHKTVAEAEATLDAAEAQVKGEVIAEADAIAETAKKPEVRGEDLGLPDEAADALNSEARDNGVGVEVRDVEQLEAEQRLPNSDEPFAQRQDNGIATINRQNGNVVINKRNFGWWYNSLKQKGFGPKDIKTAIKSLIEHEKIHLYVSDAMAKAYWKSLSWAEKKIAVRRNEGRWSSELDTDTLRGHEAIRYRLQQLIGKKTWELAEEHRVSEVALVKSLDAMEAMIRTIKRVSKGKLSKLQQAMLDKAQDNINFSRMAEAIQRYQKAEPSNPKATSKDQRRKAYEHYIGATQKEADDAKAAGNLEYAAEKQAQVESLKRGLAELDQMAFPEATTKAKEDPYQLEFMAIRNANDFSEMRKVVAGDQKAIAANRKRELDIANQEAGQSPLVEPAARSKSEKWFDGFSDEELKEIISDKKARLGFWTNAMKEKRAEIEAYSGSAEAKEDLLTQLRVLKERGQDTEAELSVYLEEQKRRNSAGAQLSFPMARTKDRSNWGQDKQAGFGFQNTSQFQAKHFAEKTAAGERPAPEGATLPPLSAAQLERHASDYLAAEMGRIAQEQKTKYSEPPSFSSFAEYMKGKQPEIKPGQLNEMWQNTVAKMLDAASGEQIQSMLKAAFDTRPTKKGEAKESIWGKMKIPDRGSPAEFEKVALAEIEMLKSGQPELALGDVALAPKTASRAPNQKSMIEDANTIRREIAEVKDLYRRRQKAIAVLYKKLVRPMKDLAKLERKSVTTDDIRYGGDGEVGAYEEFRAGSERDPLVERQLTSQHRTKNDSPGVTKRLTAIMDKESGATYLVSTYTGKEGELRMADPAMAGRESSTGESIWRRYRLIASVLLDAPVKKFVQKFETLEEYNERFGKDAKKEEQAHYDYSPPSIKDFLKEFDASEGLPTSSVMGPERRAFDIAAGLAGGSIQEGRTAPLTSAEIAGLREYVLQHEGKVEVASDVENAIRNLPTEYKAGAKGSRSAVTALSKIASSVEAKFKEHADKIKRELSVSGNKDKIGEVVDTIPESQLVRDVSAEIFSMIEQAVAPVSGKTLAEQAPAPKKGGAIFLSQSRKAIMSPHPEQPGLPKPTAPEMLSPEEVRRLKTRPTLNEKGEPVAPYTPTEFEVGRQIFAPESPEMKSGNVAYYPTRAGKPSLTRNLLKERSPMAVSKYDAHMGVVDRITNEFFNRQLQLLTSIDRRTTVREMRGRGEGFQNLSGLYSHQIAEGLRLVSQELAGGKKFDPDHVVNTAPMALIASGGFDKVPTGKTVRVKKDGVWQDVETTEKRYLYSREHTQQLIDWAKQGIAKAKALIAEGLTKKGANGWKLRHTGQKWEDASKRLLANAEYVLRVMPENPNAKVPELDWSPEWRQIHDMTTAVKEALHDQLKLEVSKGRDPKSAVDTYFPGIYEGELFNLGSVKFGRDIILGSRNYKQKVFANHFEAISEGPYIPKGYDVTNYVEHRVARGMRHIQRDMWKELYKTVRDPKTGLPILREAVPSNFKPVEGPDGQPLKDDKGKMILAPDNWKGPSAEYDVVPLTSNSSKPIAVLRGYKSTVSNLWGSSGIENTQLGATALHTSSLLKHGAILIYDTFHAGRLAQYTKAALPGNKFGNVFMDGYTALNFRPKDYARAEKLGIISKQSREWAEGTVALKDNYGMVRSVPRHEILDMMVRRGLNASKIADAMSREAVEKIPLVGHFINEKMGVGWMNRMLFGKLVPGMISQTAVHQFERLHKKYPNVPYEKLMFDINTDINAYYGNMGKQGVFGNPMVRDLSQILFLAPMWQEGLIGKEMRLFGRLTGVSNLTGRRGMPQMGALGNSMMTGLAAYFVLTQLINLVTRRQLTFQNEKGHELDAWIPNVDGDGGYWLSPMSVFLEKTHHLIKLAESKPKLFDAVRQMGDNALGPVGRAGLVMVTGSNPRGQYISSTAGVFKEAGKQLAPVPISLGKPLQWAASQAGLAPKLEKGEVARQLLASGLGVKTDANKDAAFKASQLAQKFVKENGLRIDSVKFVPTDEASYAKLRNAIRLEDFRTADSLMKDLLKVRSQRDVFEAVRDWAKRPFTGSQKHENMWYFSMSPEEVAIYHEALKQREELYEKFIQWFLRSPIASPE